MAEMAIPRDDAVVMMAKLLDHEYAAIVRFEAKPTTFAVSVVADNGVGVHYFGARKEWRKVVLVAGEHWFELKAWELKQPTECAKEADAR